MSGKTMVFEPDTVVRYFKREEFEQIPEERLHNIIINIFPYETKILADWEGHFQSVSVPHAVVKTRKLIFGSKPVLVFEIWAEKIVGRNHHKEKIREAIMVLNSMKKTKKAPGRLGEL